MATFIDDLVGEMAELLRAKYPDCREFRPASSEHPDQILRMMEWSEPVQNPKLKVRSLSRNIMFHADRANLYTIDILSGSFPYADPGFPDTLYRELGI